LPKRQKKIQSVGLSKKIYDKNISTNSDFIVAFDQWLLMIWSDGLSATIKRYLTKV
jgi:hypothetical protein